MQSTCSYTRLVVVGGEVVPWSELAQASAGAAVFWVEMGSGRHVLALISWWRWPAVELGFIGPLWSGDKRQLPLPRYGPGGGCDGAVNAGLVDVV